MDYLFVFAAYSLCCMLHILITIKKLRVQFPQFGFKEIWNTFFTQNWDTLIGSAVVLLIYELAIYIAVYNGVVLPYWFDMIGMYAIAAVLGYQGQRIFYKWLDTAVEALEKKADMIKDKADSIK